jgi:hypothetical protein
MNIIKIGLIRRSKSKTYRFAAFMAALMSLESVFGLLQPYLPGSVYAYFSVALTVGLAYYREVTHQSLKDK